MNRRGALALAVLFGGLACTNPSDSLQNSVAPRYSVTYAGNGNVGGAVPVATTTFEQGQLVTVAGNTGNLVKTGDSFAGWNTTTDGLGTTYSQGQTFAMGAANVTLYAKWTTAPTFAVTYDGNGATGGAVPASTTRYEAGQLVSASGNTGTLVKAGSLFGGWNTLSDGSGTTYTASQTFAMGSADVMLYARWTQDPTFNVTYHGNGNTGGSNPIDTVHYAPGQMVAVLGNTGNLIRSGSAFVGWNTLANGTGTSYNAGGTFAMGSANVNLYAEWVPTYMVTYLGNGSSGGVVPVDSVRYPQAASVTVLANMGSLVNSGYTFAGWNSLADGSGTDYAVGATFPIGSGDADLYAKWAPWIVPAITTTVVSGITGTQAASGGDIGADGGAAVTARGVCWSTSPAPTIGGPKTSNGTGNGSFVSALTGLRLATTYYVRAYATNGVGTAYGNEVTFTTAATYSFGDSGPARGFIFYYNASAMSPWHYLEAAGNDQTATMAGGLAVWGDETVSLATPAGIGSGLTNTATIVISFGAGTGFAAGLCDALVLGSQSDWFLPSKDELNQMWVNLATIGNFSSGYYWSSSENATADAWTQSLVGGGLQTYPKGNATVNTRCVRRF
jgi:hypothetical protein